LVHAKPAKCQCIEPAVASGIGFAGFVGFERIKYARCQRIERAVPEPLIRAPRGRGKSLVGRECYR
jgi:hypothetical protein